MNLGVPLVEDVARNVCRGSPRCHFGPSGSVWARVTEEVKGCLLWLHGNSCSPSLCKRFSSPVFPGSLSSQLAVYLIISWLRPCWRCSDGAFGKLLDWNSRIAGGNVCFLPASGKRLVCLEQAFRSPTGVCCCSQARGSSTHQSAHSGSV